MERAVRSLPPHVRCMELAYAATTSLLRGLPEREVLTTLLRATCDLLDVPSAWIRVRGVSVEYVRVSRSGTHAIDGLAEAPPGVELVVSHAGEALGVLAFAPAPAAADVLAEALAPILEAIAQALSLARTRRSTEERLRKEREALRVINDILAFPELDPALKFSRALSLGCRFLGMSTGVLSQVDGEVCRVVAEDSSTPGLEEGRVFNTSETLAGVTLSSRGVTTLLGLARTELADRVCHRDLGFESYVGAPVRVEGATFGVIWFASPAVREDLDEAELEFVRMLARWAGSVIERKRSLDALIASEERQIAALTRAAEEQREAAARIRGIVDTVADSIISLDEESRIERVNPAAEAMFGWTASELTGRSFADLVPDDGGRSNVAALVDARGAIRTGLRKDGTTLPIELGVSPMDVSGRRMFTVVIRDITEQKRIEDALQLASAKSQSLLDAIPDLMLELDDSGRFIDYQTQHAELLMPPDVFIGALVDDVLDAETAMRVRKAMADVGEHGGASVFEYGLGGQDFEARLVRMATGGFLMIIRNITERKRVERLKSEFVSTVSHELRTPLTSIRGSLGLVTSGRLGEVPDKAKNLLTIALKNSERLSTLINDILDIEKIESGRMRFDFAKHDVDALVEHAVETVRGYGQTLDVGFTIECRSPGALARVDHDRFLQVMANLLSNAAKFSPKGGLVGVRVETEYDVVKVSVADRGPGIPEAFRPHVFERFTQADSSDVRRAGGTGLGLSIARAIVEKMGERIAFDTETGKGTTFYFSLPLIELARPTSSDDVVPAVDDRARILHVEDDDDLCSVVATLAEGVGQCDRAATLGEARERLGRSHYDLVILDLELPDGVGWELLEVDRPGCPVIVFSGRPVRREDAPGVTATLVKSSTSNDELLRMISSLVRRREQGVPAS